MKNDIPLFLLNTPSSPPPKRGGGKINMSYIDKGIESFAGILKEWYTQWELASKKGLFHELDNRIKVVFWLFFIVVISFKKEILPELGIFFTVFALLLLSRVNLINFYRKIFLLGFIFGFLISFPSSLNVITHGKVLFPIITLSKPYDFWSYHIPEVIGFTAEGFSVVTMLTLRVLNSLSISFLILYTTPFPEIIKALKVLKIPDTFLIIISLAYKYIFIFARIVADMHLAKKGRLVSAVKSAEARNWVAGRIAFIFRKARLKCDDVFKAMVGRGFSGEIKLYQYQKIAVRDWIVGFFLFALGSLFLWI
jgi:energy-coupling factor transporter transmembrane protein EcfT